MTTTTIESIESPAATKPAQRKLLYPALVVAAVSVTLFSLLGIATLTGVLPNAHSNNPQAAATVKAPANDKSVAATPQASASKARATAAPVCGNCGKVESVTTVEGPAKTSGVGAVAGGLTGALLGNQIGRGDGRTVMTIAGGAGGAYLGNKIEQNTTRRTTSYRIVVRMDNGSLRTIHQTEPPNVVIGGTVQIVGNTVVAAS
ncbi:MAG: glycine zipper 2TM domain-containing protein [Rhodocyclales bacterium]|nr:glycine zipper 2TM domain-containing protein [Rhodocyclales bacterium]